MGTLHEEHSSFLKIVQFMRQCGKYYRAGQTTNDNKPKATNTHSEYVILIAFHCNSGCTNTPQCYSVHTLPVFFVLCK
jgi:hypothetical protein